MEIMKQAARIVSVLVVTAAAPFLRAQDPAPIKIGNVTLSGSIRSRVYYWDWFNPTAGGDSYVYSGNIFRIGLSQNRARLDWNAEFAVPVLLQMPSDATGTGPQQGALGLGGNYFAANGSRNAAMIFPKQLYLRFHDRNQRQYLQIGRFEFNDGSELTPKIATVATVKRDRIMQRLIGTFGFSDVGRSFDGIHYSAGASHDNFTLVAAVPTRGVFQADGWGWNRAAFQYAAYTHDSGTAHFAADTRFFFIEYEDYREILKTDNRPLAVRRADPGHIRIDTYGGHSLQAIDTPSGIIDFLLWGAVQTGKWGGQIQRASSFDAEGGFQTKAFRRLRPWLRGGYTYGSGDKDPSDNRHETFFQLLPTPRPYARFPFYNMMNTEDRYGILLLRPSAKVTISSEFHSIRLSNANDLWYSGGGLFQPWTFGYAGRSTSGRRSLGNLYDTSLEVRPTRRLTLTGYFGFTRGLAAMEQIYPRGKNGSFAYLEIFQRF